MKLDIVTVEDLEKCKTEILTKLEELLGVKSKLQKKYLKSHEVMEEFQISQTKLYEMRRAGQIPCMKVGGQYLYEYDALVRFFTLR